MDAHEKYLLRLQILKILENTPDHWTAASILADQMEVKHDALVLAQ